MGQQIISLLFLIGAIVLGFTRKINIGIVAIGLAFVLSLFGGVETGVILGGFPSKLFLTLLGTMFFFCLLQDNGTLELLSKKMVALSGGKTFLVPIILYAVSYVMSAVGPGAISVQSVMIIFAVSLSVQMKASPILFGGMAILGAVGGTASPIALSGIIVADLTANMGISGLVNSVFIGVSVANVLCAIVLYLVFQGFRLRKNEGDERTVLPAFNKQQLLCVVALLVLVTAVVGLQMDVGLVSFALSVILMMFQIVNEKSAIKLVPWSVLILICGVNVLMEVVKEMGGIDLLSGILASMMNETTASPIIALTAGIMSWFSSANGVVLSTLIPTVPQIAASVGGTTEAMDMIIAIVAGATVAGISPLSTGGSLILASYTQETNASESEQQEVFGKLFLTSFGAVMVVVLFALVGGFSWFH